MKIKDCYALRYELDGIYIVKTAPDGSEQDVSPISETAAMAWEGIEKGIEFSRLVDAIVEEFDGADEATVSSDLKQLMEQLKALGYAEE